MGIALKDKGDLDAAVDSYKQALKIKPDYAEAYSNMGNALRENGELEAAIDSYKQALKIKPDYADAVNNLANTFIDLGRYEDALERFDLVDTHHSKAKSLECLYNLERYDEVNSRLAKICQSDQENIRLAAFSAFFANQTKQADPHPFCKNPLDFIYFGSMYNHYPDVEGLIERILKEAENEKQVWEPLNRATKSGFQTDVTIFQVGESVEFLKTIIATEIDSYYSKFKTNDCSFVSLWPSEFNLRGWFVRLLQGGHQTAHIHPGGWLSGVVYLKVIQSPELNEGAIEFGLHGYNWPILDERLPRKIHQPQKGDIVLFPSSLFHRTIPVATKAERCVIAFDLHPIRNTKVLIT